MKNRRNRRSVVNVEQMEGRLLLSAAPQFTVKDLGPNTYVSGINSSGQITGQNALLHAFLTDPNGGTIHDLGTGNVEGSIASIGYGVNDSGQVVVVVQVISGNSNCSFLSAPNGGPLKRLLPSPGFQLPDDSLPPEMRHDEITARSVNASGQVTGEETSTYGGTHAFLSGPNGDNLKDLGVSPGDWISFGVGVNDSGQVVGRGSSHIFLSDPNGGALHNLDPSIEDGFAVNNSGQVAGVMRDVNGSVHAFLSDTNGGTPHNLGTIPGYTYDSVAEGINNSGEVVGYASTDNPGIGRAFAYINNVMYDLNGLIPSNSGLTLNIATGVNSSGQIIVNATDSNGVQHGVLLTPVVPPVQITPTITWPTPADIVYGTPLSSTQLDATANVPGTFAYSVPEGTVLHAGLNQTLVATFTPTDTVHYTTATATTSINVYTGDVNFQRSATATITYGTPLRASMFNVSVDVPGTFVYSIAEGTIVNAGLNQPFSIFFYPTDAADYGYSYVGTSILNVLPAPLTITANNATKVLGQANPPLTGTITGLVNGDTDVATYTTTATTSSPIGTYPITPSLTDSNYNITFVNGTLTVVPPTISLANGVVTINGQLDSGSVATVSFDQATGNVKVVLNGYTVQYARASVRQINYIGSPNGHDTYSNGTNLASSATLYGGNNTCMAGPGANYWTMYGTGNSIRDDGGVNYVYRHGYAVSETGTGLFVNLS